VRLRPGIPDLTGQVTVVAENSGEHADLVAVYLAYVTPGGSQNLGGCSPSGVSNLGAAMLQPRDKITIAIDPGWQCAGPALVNGLFWTLHAFADAHGDDFQSCATIQQVLGGICSAALADDDDLPADNTDIRLRPKVAALGP